MLKMLIAVDGSQHADRAIAAVAEMVRSATANVEVTLVHVRDLPIYPGDLPVFDADQVEDLLKRKQDEILAAAARHAESIGLKVVSQQRAVGSPGLEIVAVATQCGADQIAMGTHGRGGIGSLFIGSVAQRVVHLSKLPVLLVK
ncbi:MAG: universal stress protein [Burkholderiales bacterium]